MGIEEIGKPGFRYRTDFKRPGSDLIDAYKVLMDQTGCLTGNVGDCLGRMAAMDSRIKGLSQGMKVVGPALTVKVPPSDNLMIHKALTLVKPGDVLVIDGGGDHAWALLGFLMVSTAIKLGLAGMVVDGCIRDAAEIRASGFPVFAAGINPNGPMKNGPGEINFPIQCGGQLIHPGDMIVADDDGVVVVPQAHAAGTVDKVKAVIVGEEKRLAEIIDGVTSFPGLDEMLKQKGLG
ncbi:MAG: RraA family protein [Deltaproteobacteria bacterium]|jgi:RraA family protein|nr:RraA family protein [Deltaproteobacteria bacterium]